MDGHRGPLDDRLSASAVVDPALDLVELGQPTLDAPVHGLDVDHEDAQRGLPASGPLDGFVQFLSSVQRERVLVAVERTEEPELWPTEQARLPSPHRPCPFPYHAAVDGALDQLHVEVRDEGGFSRCQGHGGRGLVNRSRWRTYYRRCWAGFQFIR